MEATGRDLPLAVIGFLIALAVGTLALSPPPISMNDASRWATVDSLIHRGTFVINDSNYGDTIDRAKRVDETGKEVFVSSKPAFTSTWVAAVAYPFVQAGLDIAHPFRDSTRRTMAILLTLINVVPFSICLWFYWRFLGREGFGRWAAGVSLVTAGLGTYVTGYLTTLSNHVPGAICVFACALAFRAYGRGGAGAPRLALLAALMAGLAAAHEAPALLLGPVVLLVIVRRTPRLALGAAACFVLPLAAFAFIEWMATGLPLPKQAQSVLGIATTYRMDDYWMAPTGADALHDPLPVRLFHMTFGHHGVFSHHPIFLLGLLPLAPPIARRMRREAGGYLVVLGMSVVTFVFFWLRTANYGGFCQGMRWLFWVIPLWLMVLPHVLDTAPMRTIGARVVTAAALAVSVWSTVSCLEAPWGLSWVQAMLE